MEATSSYLEAAVLPARSRGVHLLAAQRQAGEERPWPAEDRQDRCGVAGQGRRARRAGGGARHPNRGRHRSFRDLQARLDEITGVGMRAAQELIAGSTPPDSQRRAIWCRGRSSPRSITTPRARNAAGPQVRETPGSPARSVKSSAQRPAPGVSSVSVTAAWPADVVNAGRSGGSAAATRPGPDCHARTTLAMWSAS